MPFILPSTSKILTGNYCPHVHFHIVPRMADQPEDRCGPNVFSYLGGPQEECVSEEEMTEIAVKVRCILLA
jgi:diadenosine tetraphosphate (Ap4A) HIT family hydrolase